MSTRTLYWLLQLIGWGFVFILNVSLASIGERHLAGASTVITFGMCSLSGLILSHGWRKYTDRNRYIEMKLSQSAPRYLCGIALFGCTLTFLAAVWYRIFLIPDTFRRVDWIPFAVLFWTAVFALWTGIHVAAKHLRRADESEKDRLQTELLAKDARLAALRQQLNPHFLFNSLNSLRALIFEDTQKASEMVDRLAALLRYSLQAESNELVTLAEELVMVNEYLSIERIRFEDRLHIDMTISAASTNSLLPRMLLQTLVENAVKHGIEPSLSGGTVAILAETKNGDLCITVRNPGMLQPVSNLTRLGLKNAEQRLSLLKGAHAGLNIRQAGVDVEATVVVPQ